MEVEITIPLDEEPWERLLIVDAIIDHVSQTRTYPGHTHTEIVSVEWSEHDPVPAEERGDPVLLFEEHEEQIREDAFEKVRDHEIETRYDVPDTAF